MWVWGGNGLARVRGQEPDFGRDLALIDACKRANFLGEDNDDDFYNEDDTDDDSGNDDQNLISVICFGQCMQRRKLCR